MDFSNQSLLFASLLWGSIGMGYWIYGKKQSSFPAMIGGAAIMLISYFMETALSLSLACVGIMAVVFWLIRQGH